MSLAGCGSSPSRRLPYRDRSKRPFESLPREPSSAEGRTSEKPILQMPRRATLLRTPRGCQQTNSPSMTRPWGRSPPGGCSWTGGRGPAAESGGRVPVRGSVRCCSIWALRPSRSSSSRGSSNPASEFTMPHPLRGALRASEEPPRAAFHARVERLCPGRFNVDQILKGAKAS